MDPAIETTHASKFYGNVHAVCDLSLLVRPGEIYGFVGLNGAGKTTTIRMLLGMIRLSAGSVTVLGAVVRGGRGPWARVGYLVESPSFYPDLTVRENLEVVRRLRSIKDKGAVERVIGRLGLEAYGDRRARTLSLGNAQRLGLAKALFHEPELVFLDEPANGLDPAGVVEVRQLIRELAGKGTTIFMSSHILTEVSRLATRIGIIHEGRLLEELDEADVERHSAPRLVVDARDREAAHSALASAGYRVKVGDEGHLEISDNDAIQSPDKISWLLAEAGFPPTMLRIAQDDLETHFLRLVGSVERGGR